MNRPKLLHVSLGSHNQEIWRSFERHFETRHYDWTTQQGNPHVINADVRLLADQFDPDIIFFQLQKGGVISVPTMKYLSEKSTTVLWGGDVRPVIPRWEVDLGLVADISLHVNMHYVDELCKLGVNSQYLNVGFDENQFNHVGTKSHTPDIIFLGTNYLTVSNFPLSLKRMQLVQMLTSRYGDRFAAYGNGWRGVVNRESYLQQNEEAQAYRSCKIAINLSHFDYGRYSSDRIMRIMGSGAFCLSHDFKDIEMDFKVGEHLDTFKSLDQLTSKIDYWIDNPVEREKIASQGCEYVRNTYTWNHFMLELKKILGYPC